MTAGDEPAAECFRCGGPATETFGGTGAYLCADCIGDLERDVASDADADGSADVDETPTPEPAENGTHAPPSAREPRFAEYAGADFPSPGADTYATNRLECEQWMGRAGESGKLPFAPWADPDAPIECTNDEHDAETCDQCECDARWKWGHRGNYVDGETVAIAEDDPRLAGRVFIQREGDGWAFVDGDDVRCPETGEVHPAFVAILEHLGLTYTDVSDSGTGVHAQYRGEWPLEGTGQETFQIDTEPWGANDDVPTVEIYANKHVCVDTGCHVPGTPLEATEWDADALRAILEAVADDDPASVDHDTDRERSDLTDYEPTATDVDETTTEVRDVLAAVDRLRPIDLPLRTGQVGTDSTGWEQWDPSTYRQSSGNDSLHRPAGESVFHDHKTGESFGLLGLFAAEQGIISKPWHRLAGAEWWETVDAAREAGAPIPEYVGGRGEASEPVAVLPDSPQQRAITQGWDWTVDDRHDGGLTIDEARERTTDAIGHAYERCDDALVEALPTTGKSFGSVAAAAETDVPVTITTGRGRKEQYALYREWADEHGLTHYTLPAFTHDCDTANGECGEEWADRVMRWYNAGATPQQIHKYAENELGRPLPCQTGERECPYTAKWRFEPDDYDVLIGHYTHLHAEGVTQGRTIVVDEFPEGAFETVLEAPERAISTFLAGEPDLPFDDYTDLLENRDDDGRRADALLWFDDRGVDRDGFEAFAEGGHAAAPLAVFTLLASDDLGNGWERARIGDAADGRVGVFNRANGDVAILDPPSLDYARNVVALDGTPTPRLWRVALGRRLNHRRVLSREEAREYITEALNHRYVRTTEAIKSYSPGESEIESRVSLAEDRALFEAIADREGRKPDLITPARAEAFYGREGALEHVAEHEHHGNTLGSNRFAGRRLGVVAGCQNYGPDYVKKWAAYAGEASEPTFPGPENDFAPTRYGEPGSVAEAVREHMIDHQTLQNVMRFGRDGNGAVVYVHTNTLPEWVPIADEARVIHTRSEGERQVIEAARDLGSWTTADLAAHDAVDLSRRQVFTHLERLADRGYLSREQNAADGRGFRWTDDGLRRAGDYGDVDLPDPPDAESGGGADTTGERVRADDLRDAEVREVARIGAYRWDFTKIPDSAAAGRLERDQSSTTGADDATTAADPPGTDAD